MGRFALVFLVFVNVIFWTGNGIPLSAHSEDISQGPIARPEIVLQTGHRNLVKAVAVSPDGLWAATGSLDTTIRIWDTESGRELRSMTGQAGAVKALAISPDGKWLASGGNDAALRIWNVETGAEAKKFSVHEGTIDALAYSPDGKRLISGGTDQKARLLDAESGKTIFTFDTLSVVSSLAFSPDGLFLASGGSDKVVRLWNLSTGKKTRELKGHTDEISALRFSENGTLLASGSVDMTIRLWRTANGDKAGTLTGHAGKIVGVAFSLPDRLLAADFTGVVKTWNLVSKTAVQSVSDSADRAILGDAESAAFSSDGSFVLMGNGGGTASVVNTGTGIRSNLLENHTTGFYGIAFSSNRQWLASASYDNSVKLWDLQTGQSLAPLRGHAGRVTSVAFADEEGRRLISASLDASIIIWDTVTFKPSATLKGHERAVTTVAVGTKGKLLVSGSADKTIAIWALDTNRKLRTLTGHTAEVINVAISSDEKTIASSSLDGTIKLWNVSDGSNFRSIDPKIGQINSVAFSPDGRFIASGGADKAVNIWDAATGDKIQTMTGHTGPVYSVAFRNDGKQIISAGQDKVVRLWNGSDAREIKTFAGHTGTIFKTSFLPDERWLASASEDGSIVIWNTESGSPLARLISLKDSDDWLAVTPEGFFDGSQSSWRQISWRFENNTFNVKPVEEFFSEFWLPGLLSELLSGGKLPPGNDISKKDRRQPLIKLSVPDLKQGTAATERFVKVRIDVARAPAGAKDVRLFRNGSLTRIWRNDVLKGQKAVSLEAVIPIVAGENRLTAYAFNSDDIKSRDDAMIVTGVPGLTRKGVLFLLTIGVNEYANKEFDLTYAVDDAKEFGDEFRSQQSSLNSFQSTEIIPLRDKNATKANILKALADLSAKIQPEDALVVFFAGHGIAKQQRFYLIPHDLGFMGQRSTLGADGVSQIVANGLSDLELEQSVENINAGQFLLVIDACNSGQAIESAETRRGPMNSKGLAQLAYEKGMFILTASQGFQAAKEDARLGHGYLTFALIEEGLKSRAADRQPKDGQILLREWLDFAAERVPQIDQEEGEKSGRKARKLEREKAKKAGQVDAEGLQRPRVFYRRETELRPLVVAGSRQ